jgi:AraC family transcriptional regulator, transcriptional activator of pobA
MPSSTTSTTAHPVASQFIALLEGSPNLHMSVGHCAHLLGVTPGHLNVICKKEYGCKAYDMIQQAVLNEAKKQLLETDKKIKQVADELGFRDSAHFCNFFKKHTSQSAEMFRKNALRP